MNKHKNIPVFIPHVGCPNDCIFCNQRSISGTRSFDISSVRGIIENALATIPSGSDVQLAFFGGSFTGIDRKDMLYLLGIGKEFIDKGAISSIRLSTRPDYISAEILEILKAHGVRSVELGIQSMSDRVLSVCGRGHTAEDSRKACRLIKKFGFELVGQMMTSLPCSSRADDTETARQICELGADGARIYPTMVFAGTPLESLVRSKEYVSPSLAESISLCTDVFDVFCEHGVDVIRIGLAEGDGLHEETGIVSGAYHPAMGELVLGEHYYRLIEKKLFGTDTDGKTLIIECASGEVSKIIGQCSINKKRIIDEHNVKIIKVIENPDVLRYNCILDII